MNKKNNVKVKTTTRTANVATIAIVAILAIGSPSTMVMAHRDHHHDDNSFSNSGQDSGGGNSGSSSLGCRILAFGAGTLLSGGNVGVGAAAASVCS